MRAGVLLSFLIACGGTPASTPPAAEAPAAAPAQAAAPAEAAAPAGSRRDTDVAAFKDVHAKGGIKLIDVRTPEEFASGHIPGAVNVPVNEVSPSNPTIAALSKDEEVYVVCAVGGRSSAASDTLAAGGYKAVNVGGGTEGWKAAGLPVE
jgi:rhodanese-related sulfurtransferase